MFASWVLLRKANMRRLAFPAWVRTSAEPTAMTSIVANGVLVRKVAFPREHLVVSTVGAGLFTLAVEIGVLSIALIVVGNMVLPWLPLVVVTSLLLAVFACGFGLALA